MIRAEVKIIGTIRRSASMRTNSTGTPELSFFMSVSVPDVQTGNKDIDIWVSLPEAHENDVANYQQDYRVAVEGTMDIRRNTSGLLFFLVAKSATTNDVPEVDSITGNLTFRGHLKKEKVYEQKTDKNGNPFLVFSAYSSEKVGDEFLSTWVNFMRFPEKNADVEHVDTSCLQPRANVVIKGDLTVSSYNGQVRLSCRVRDIQPYVKPAYQS